MNINRNTLKFLIKQVIKESKDQTGEEQLEKELSWKKIIDNLQDEGFRLLVLKSITNANAVDPEFISDMFETLTREDDREVQQIIINHLEKIYKDSEL